MENMNQNSGSWGETQQDLFDVECERNPALKVIDKDIEEFGSQGNSKMERYLKQLRKEIVVEISKEFWKK